MAGVPEDGNVSKTSLDIKLLEAKVEEQSELISLMQAQIDVQMEKLSEQEKLIEELTLQVTELQLREKQTETEKKSSSGDQGLSNGSKDWANGKALPENSTLADIVKETAEEAMKQSGFVYDENSKLYYDFSTGYYYDPVRKLYYNGHTRTYYSYDESTGEYSFHSQLSPLPLPSQIHEPDDDIKFLKRTRKDLVKKRRLNNKIVINYGVNKNKLDPEIVGKERPIPKLEEKMPKSIKKKPVKKVKNLEEIEEGEISSESDSSSKNGEVIEISDSGDSDSDISIREIEPAPCIRAIVSDSSVPDLKKGFLFIVTCTGGSIGREGGDHTILLEDINVSKRHAAITYGEPISSRSDTDCDNIRVDDDLKSNGVKYCVHDLGSQNGTFLNGTRLSEPSVQSESFEIVHGSTLKIGSTTLLLHIHPGDRTCGHCEPGLVMVKDPVQVHVQTKAEKEASRKKQLKKLRVKYGIEHPSANNQPRLPAQYADRAKDRRVVSGSDNPFEKTAVASIDEAIQPDNKGFKMLSKMGWKAGKTLGAENSGIHEPIKIQFKQGRGGLGSSEFVRHPQERPSPPMPSRRPKSYTGPKKVNKDELLKKTIARFQQIPGTPSDVPEVTLD